MEILFIVIQAIVSIGAVFSLILFGAAANVWGERKTAAYMQQRFGPNRLGPAGILQPFADVLKLFLKEDIVPAKADKFYHALAPMIMLFAAFAVWAVIPFGDHVTIMGHSFQLGIATETNVGLLYILAITSLGVYATSLAGWSSNNKYSLLGGLRAAAQMISYELTMGLSILAVVVIVGSFNLNDIVYFQNEAWGGWRWLVVLQPLGFFIFLISAFAETNRAPFDFPEAEQELVAGFNTEYSSMRFGMFFLGEYVNMTLSAAFMVLLYFGGWALPFDASLIGLTPDSPYIAAMQFGWFLSKVIFFIFIFFWVRWTLPRFRYDQLMHLGWKVLLPLSILNLLVTALVVYLF